MFGSFPTLRSLRKLHLPDWSSMQPWYADSVRSVMLQSAPDPLLMGGSHFCKSKAGYETNVMKDTRHAEVLM